MYSCHSRLWDVTRQNRNPRLRSPGSRLEKITGEELDLCVLLGTMEATLGSLFPSLTLLRHSLLVSAAQHVPRASSTVPTSLVTVGKVR